MKITIGIFNLVFSLLITSICFSQSVDGPGLIRGLELPFKKDRKFFNLKDSVKSVTSRGFRPEHFNFADSLININSTWFFYDQLDFDSNGRLISKTSGDYRWQESYRYDHKGRLIRSGGRQFNWIDADSAMIVYYDSLRNNGLPLSGVLYKLNRDSLVVETIKYWRSSDSPSIFRYELDSSNQIIRSVNCNEFGKVAFDRSYEYNTNGRLTKMVSILGKGGTDEIIKMEYDEFGNSIKTTIKYPSTITSYETSYEYDEFGNWIKSTNSKNGTVFRIFVREIEYY